jgi:fibronectin-binding autotransporter adhesin
MATRQWAVNTNGTFDFNNPANWTFATVPGAVDVAQFNTNATDTVTGDATVAELLVTQGTIDLTGSYTMSGAQATELSAANATLAIDAGASISGTGNISVSNGGLFLGGTLAGGSATISNSLVILSPGSAFDVGSVTFGGASNDLGVGPPHFIQINLETNNAIQVSGSIAAIGTQLTIAGTISGTGSLFVIDATELDGNNTYSGGTTLGLGVLAVGNANALGTGALSISGGELLATELLATVTETINNQLTMSGSFTIAAAHGQTLTISPAHPWTLNTDPITSELVAFGTPGVRTAPYCGPLRSDRTSTVAEFSP